MSIGLPLAYHIGLAASVDPPSHVFMPSYFFLNLPWMLWLYMGATAVVGLFLVLSGLHEKKD